IPVPTGCNATDLIAPRHRFCLKPMDCCEAEVAIASLEPGPDCPDRLVRVTSATITTMDPRQTVSRKRESFLGNPPDVRTAAARPATPITAASTPPRDWVRKSANPIAADATPKH